MPRFSAAMRRYRSADIMAGQVSMTSSAVQSFASGQRGRLEQVVALPGIPRVSGREAARAFASVGYEIVRQRGSHLRLRHPAKLASH